LKAKKDLSSGNNLKLLLLDLDDELLLTLFDVVDGMSHEKENLNEGLYCRHPDFKRNV